MQLMQNTENPPDRSGLTQSSDEGGGGSPAQENEAEGNELLYMYPYLQDVRTYHGLLSSVNIKDRIRGATELGQASWNGGEVVQSYIGKIGAVRTMLDILANKQEPQNLKLKIIQALSVVSHNHPENQSIMRQLDLIQTLVEFLADTHEEIRKWSANCLFYLLHGNVANQNVALKITSLKQALTAVANDSWQNWPSNDALDILKMLGLHPIDTI